MIAAIGARSRFVDARRVARDVIMRPCVFALLTFASVLVGSGVPPAFAQTGTASIARGIELFHRGEFEASVATLSSALESVDAPPERARGHLFVGLSRAILGSWPAARSAFRAALVADPLVAPDASRVPPAIVAAFEEVRTTVRGRVRIRTQQPSVVYLDGVERGGTPYDGEASVGRHHLRVRSRDQRMEAETDALVVRADETTVVNVELVPRLGRLTLSSWPKGADVWHGDKYLGRTPIEAFKIAAGSTAVVLRLPGYRDERVAVDVHAAEDVDLDVVMQLADRKRMGTAPTFGPDLREDVDAWAFVAGLGFTGGAPTSQTIEQPGVEERAVTGGVGMGAVLGLAVFDLISVYGVFGVESFGPNVDFFEGNAPSDGPTGFISDEDQEGELTMKMMRLGVEGRVTVARIGSFRPFVGLGYARMISTGRVTHLALPTSATASDAYLLRARVGGAAWTPSVGLQYLAIEKKWGDNYFAIDVVAQLRLDVLSLSTDFSTIVESPLGGGRAAAAQMQWQEIAGAERTSFAPGAGFWMVARL